MTSAMHSAANWSLKEDIRSYWSKRAETFDQSFGHRIPKGFEHDAWAEEIRGHLGSRPLDVLELASGTGEVTGVLLSLGHRVTGIDLSEAMIARSSAKHRDNPRAKFILGDAESTKELDGTFDAVVCRHLVWTLTDPQAALEDWFRVLRTGGRALIFDGDFVNLSRRGRLAKRVMILLEQLSATPPHRDPALAEEHTAILQQLPFRNGLTFETLKPLAEQAGFTDIVRGDYRRIHRAQRRIAGPHDWLRTWLHDRFILCATKR